MRVPVMIPMGGYKIRIEYVEKVDDESSAGESDDHNKTIRVSTTENKNPEHVRGTIFHELCHQAAGISGLGALLGRKQEEAMASALEHLLGPLFRLDAPGIKYREIEFAWEKE